MDTKRLAIGTLAGGGTVCATGVLLFAIPPFNAYYQHAMTAGSATGVPRESPIVWAVLLGALAYGALVTLAIDSRPSRATVSSGMQVGAVVGFLLFFTADLMLFGISNVGSLTTTLIDPLLEMVPGACGGGMIAAVLGRLDALPAPGPPRARLV